MIYFHITQLNNSSAESKDDFKTHKNYVRLRSITWRIPEAGKSVPQGDPLTLDSRYRLFTLVEKRRVRENEEKFRCENSRKKKEETN